MASATRLVSTVRRHVPLIKFPSRLSPKSLPETSINTTTLVTAVPTTLVSISQTDTTIAPSYQAPMGLTPRGSGIEHNQLPQRFRRKPIDDIEIDYIQRGGPDK